ncbi:hypothetical protein HDU93_007645 [Gonapodya sp. JEL0774]|nr:hypothetical protein HDU93_007645 [Gonapodya sp. JEL0774]
MKIIHMHAYDESTGVQKEDPELYAAIFRGIKSQVDCICYPTVLQGSRRFESMQDLARRGALEWCTLDPGSCNCFVYTWSDDHIKQGYHICSEHKIHPCWFRVVAMKFRTSNIKSSARICKLAFAIYEPGFLRAGAAWQSYYPNAPIPIYRFMFSSQYLWSFPPKPYGLTAYHSLLKDEAPGMPWMVAGLDVDISPLIEDTVKAGGHVRVGLEDAPFGTRMSNKEWTEMAVKRIGEAGGILATAQEVRTDLKEMEIEYRARKARI